MKICAILSPLINKLPRGLDNFQQNTAGMYEGICGISSKGTTWLTFHNYCLTHVGAQPQPIKQLRQYMKLPLEPLFPRL